MIGGGGWLGGAVGACLTACGRSWIGTRRTRLAGRAAPAGTWRRLDLLDRPGLRRLLAALRPRSILIAAGHPAGASEEHLRRLYLDGTAGLLAAVEGLGLTCRILVVGSAAEYGNAPAGHLDEDAPLRPLSAYGRIKALASEHALRARARGFDVVVVRVFNTTGPGQGTTLVAGALLARLARGERPLRVRDARLVRDWSDVRDVARALVLLGETPAPPPVVNICSGTGRTVGTLARRLAALAGAPVERATAPPPPAVIRRSVGAPRCLAALGFVPCVSFARSLADQWRAAGSPRQRR